MMSAPTFLVIGDLKAGSTSIYYYLRQHPEIFMPRDIKELRYFAFDAMNPYHVNAAAYRVRSYPDYLRYFDACGTARAIGEVSPNYLRSPVAAARIQSVLPQVQLIASLRNPADRLYSQFMMAVRAGRESRPFEEFAFRQDSAAIKAGAYWPDLKRYYDRFPRNKIKIVLFEDLSVDTRLVVRALYQFLGVDTDFVPNLTRQNEGGLPRRPGIHAAFRSSKAMLRKHWAVPPSVSRLWRAFEQRSLRQQAIDQHVRGKILEVCKDDIQLTAAIIERDLSHWL